jgi:integrase
MTNLEIIQEKSFKLVTPRIKTYQNRIKCLLNRNITIEDINNLIEEKKETCRPATLAGYKFAIKSALKASTNNIHDHLAINELMSNFKTQKADNKIYTENILTQEELKEIYKISSIRTVLIIKTLVETGLRVSELLNLKYCNVKLNNEFVYISVLGKGSKERRIFLPIANYNEIKKVFDGKVYLFESKKKKKLSRGFIYKIVRQAGEKIGHLIHPHTLRHTFATYNLINKGKNLKAISAYLGHASTAVTADMYIHNELKPTDLF